MKLFSLLILFSHLSFSTSESWKDCWGLDYLYYDEDCCTESSYLADPNFHCLDKIPALKNYSALQLRLHEQIDKLQSCEEVQQVCNSNLTFIQMREQTHDLHAQMRKLGEAGFNTLQPAHENLDKLINYTLMDSTFNGLIFEAGSILVVDTATFRHLTIHSPYSIPTLDVQGFGKTTNFLGKLKNVNFHDRLSIDGIDVDASSTELNSMEGINTDLKSSNINLLKGLDVEVGNLNAVKGVQLDGLNISHVELDQIVNLTTNVGDLNVLKGINTTLSREELDRLVGLEATSSELNVAAGLILNITEINNLAGMNTNVREFNTLANLDENLDISTINLLVGLDVGLRELNQMRDVNQNITKEELNTLKDLVTFQVERR